MVKPRMLRRRGLSRSSAFALAAARQLRWVSATPAARVRRHRAAALDITTLSIDQLAREAAPPLLAQQVTPAERASLRRPPLPTCAPAAATHHHQCYLCVM